MEKSIQPTDLTWSLNDFKPAVYHVDSKYQTLLLIRTFIFFTFSLSEIALWQTVNPSLIWTVIFIFGCSLESFGEFGKTSQVSGPVCH